MAILSLRRILQRISAEAICTANQLILKEIASFATAGKTSRKDIIFC